MSHVLGAATPSRKTRHPIAGKTVAPLMAGVVAMAIAVGCGPATGSPLASAARSATATATANPTDAPTMPITHETGPTDVVLRVADGGGLLPMERRLTEMPTISIYGNGRVIRFVDAGMGPTDPLMPELVESRLTPAGMTLVVGAAGDAGLLGPDRHLDMEGVYDLWVVTFILTANGATHTTRAYALGFSEEARFAPPDEMPDRKALDALFARLQDLRGWLGSGRVGPEAAYRPARMRVFVVPEIAWPTKPGATPAPATPRAGQDVRRWPLDTPPEKYGTVVDERLGTWRCGILEAAAAQRMGLDSATHDTRWQTGNQLYQVVVRPLLPDETGCPG